MENLKAMVTRLKTFCETTESLGIGDIVFVLRSQNLNKLLVGFYNRARLEFDHISADNNKFYLDYVKMLDVSGEDNIVHPLLKEII
jgi:hypothetical protein